jgi:glucans biosynthesis protein C
MINERRYDIDWIRVIVFDVLIFWHIALFFVSWDSLVTWDLPLKNNVQVSWLSMPMLFIRQWRLPILFVVSGIGSRYALSSKSAAKYTKERFIRLLVPLITGMLLVVPPQVYIERLMQGTVDVSYIKYYPDTFNGIYPEGNISWHHLWFLFYLLLMSVSALPLFLYLRKTGNRFISFINHLIQKSPLYLYVFVIPLIFIELSLADKYPLTMALKDDWYAFSFYFICFVSGYVMASLGSSLWKAFISIRQISLLFGILLSTMVLWMLSKGENPVWIQILKPVNTWSWIITIFGYGSKYLNKKSKLLSYRNRAVYPIYILHQTIIIILAYLLMDHPLHYVWKMLILLVGTYGISLVLYEFVIRRIALLGPLFGLKPERVKKSNSMIQKTNP